jgi:hypothetical protein
VGYPTSHPQLGDWYGAPSPVGITLYNGASRMADGVFPEGSKSVLFFGRVGVGQFCYGQPTGNQSLVGTFYEPGVPYCYDPTSGSKGVRRHIRTSSWSRPTTRTILAAVKAGTKQDWQVLPYSTWELQLPITFPTGPAAQIMIGSVAYDASSQRSSWLRRTQTPARGTLINVFRVQGTSTANGLCR